MSPRMGLDLATIIQAATEIADTQGIEAVTLASLAQKLDVRSPSLYNHIDGLPGLRNHLAVHGLEQLYSRMFQAAEGLTGNKAVHALSAAYIDFARSHPGLYEATLRAPDPYQTDVNRISTQIVELGFHVLSGYGLQGDAAIHAVRGLRSLLHGFASLEQRGGFGMPLDLDESFRFMIDTFLQGIQAMKEGDRA